VWAHLLSYLVSIMRSRRAWSPKRQLGAVLGVAAMGLAYAVSGSTQLDADAAVLAEGFEAAMLTAGGVVAIATVFVAAWMPNVTAMSKAS
jgi:hypothetical protein